MMINWGQELKNIFSTQLKEHAEFTALEKQQQFQEKYNTISKILTQSMYLKESNKGVMDAYIKLDNQSKDILAEKQIIVKDDDNYIEALSQFWKSESLNIRKEVKNPYAKIMLHNYSRRSLPSEINGWEKARDTLLQETGVEKVEDITRALEKNNTIETHEENYAQLTGSINNSYLSPLLKSKLIYNAKSRLADNLLQKLSIENPEKLITLYKENSGHPVIKDSTPRALSHSISNAQRNIESMDRVTSSVLEASLGQNLEIIKDHGVIKEDYFQKLFSFYGSLKSGEKQIKQLEDRINYAQKYYYAKQQIEQIPLEEREKHLQGLLPSLEKQDSYGVDKRVYEEIRNEVVSQKHLYETDPAAASDKMLLEVTNPIAKINNISQHEKRYMEQVSKGIALPKILTNTERENVAQVLATTNNSDELHIFLEMKEKEYNEFFPHFLKEVQTSKKIDIFTNKALEYYNSDNIGLMEQILTVKTKVKDGILKEDNFSDKDSVKVLKELIFTDNKKLSSLPHGKHQEIKYFLYEMSKDLFKNSNETSSVKEVKKNAEELFFSNLHIEEKIYVPKMITTIKGKEEITSKEAKDINATLSSHLKNKDYWNEEHLSKIFGKFVGDTPSIKKNQVNLARECVKNGRWVLTNDLSGYVYEMQAGNKLYYDVTEGGELNVTPIGELLLPRLYGIK